MSDERRHVVIVEDDNERIFVVLVQARNEDEARQRVNYILTPSEARIIRVVAA